MSPKEERGRMPELLTGMKNGGTPGHRATAGISDGNEEVGLKAMPRCSGTTKVW
jgi:hypothetical protein